MSRWLDDMRLMYDTECMNTLESKSVISQSTSDNNIFISSQNSKSKQKQQLQQQEQYFNLDSSSPSSPPSSLKQSSSWENEQLRQCYQKLSQYDQYPPRHNDNHRGASPNRRKSFLGSNSPQRNHLDYQNDTDKQNINYSQNNSAVIHDDHPWHQMHHSTSLNSGSRANNFEFSIDLIDSAAPSVTSLQQKHDVVINHLNTVRG